MIEYPFELPVGFDDGSGELKKKGKMRLARASDEILPLREPKVQSNPAYLSVILLSRVVTELGSKVGDQINPATIETLFSADFAYLQEMYNRINQKESNLIQVICPHCQNDLEVDLSFSGE